MAKKFSDLDATTSLEQGDLFAVAQVDENADTGYFSKKITSGNVAHSVLGEFEFPTALPSFEDPTITGGLEELKTDIKSLLPIAKASGSIATFETALSDNVVELTAEINPVQSGSGTPSPSNPRPISGFTECNIVDCEVNLWDEQAELGLLNSDGTITEGGTRYVTSFIPVVAGVEYAVHIPYSGRGRGAFYDANKNLISYYSDFPKSGESVFPDNGTIYGSGSDYYFTFIPPTGACYLIYNVVSGYGSDHISINYPSTDHDYHPYHGNLVTVAFGQTVYGGVLTCKNGAWKVVVTHGKSVLSSDWFWVKSGSYPGSFYAEVTNVGAKASAPFICSHARTVTSLSDYTDGCCYCDGSINIRIMTAETTVQEWKDYIDAQASLGTPVEICYELATPIEIDLTAEQVQTIVGLNNVFHDANGEIEVEYRDSIQHYIDSKIASVQALIL